MDPTINPKSKPDFTPSIDHAVVELGNHEDKARLQSNPSQVQRYTTDAMFWSKIDDEERTSLTNREKEPWTDASTRRPAVQESGKLIGDA
ncbi:hypothetical protein MMC09_002986 [Bachmanniomyces sp. S44760]|nr:hypothetical protein [Bachmanniomyces sp. S44760]